MKTIKMVAVALFTVLGITTAFAQKNAKPAFNKILNHYMVTKNALADDKKDKAVVDAKEFLEAVKAFPAAELKGEQKKLWDEQSAELIKGATPISSNNVLKDQRESFKTVSYAMIKLVKGLKMNSSEIYLQYCPMVKSSWLNEVKAVQNPYYGSMMYDCGEVKETISKK